MLHTNEKRCSIRKIQIKFRKKIGKGSFSKIYKAIDIRKNRSCCKK